jgi:tetratricopeptide (TPR) repeat protein
MVEKAIELKQNDPKYYTTLVEIKYNQNNLEDSINIMEKVVKLRPSNIGYMEVIAKLYEDINDKINAKKYFFKILEIDPLHEKAKQKVKNL